MTQGAHVKQPVLDRLLAALDDDREEDLAVLVASASNPASSLDERIARLERLVTQLRLVIGAALELAAEKYPYLPRSTPRTRAPEPVPQRPTPLTPEEREAKRRRDRRLRLLNP